VNFGRIETRRSNPLVTVEIASQRALAMTEEEKVTNQPSNQNGGMT